MSSAVSSQSSARERILGKLRAAPVTAAPAIPDIDQWFAGRQRYETLPQRTARLRAALEAAHAEVFDTTVNDWPSLLMKIAAGKGIRNLLIGTGTAHCAALEACHPQTLELIRYEQSIETFRDRLFDDIDAGLTLAKGAIAETGSLILWPDTNEPRLLSLVPPLHFVLVDVETIHTDFNAAMRDEQWKDALPTNALLVSGPSKTADIQQTLAYGAHGPREVVVLLLNNQGGAA